MAGYRASSKGTNNGKVSTPFKTSAKAPQAGNTTGAKRQSYAPQSSVVKIPRPGGLTVGGTHLSNAPTKPLATPALHKQYAAKTRVVKNPKTQGVTRQQAQLN